MNQMSMMIWPVLLMVGEGVLTLLLDTSSPSTPSSPPRCDDDDDDDL